MNKNKKSSSIVSLVLLIVLVAIGFFWFKPNWDDVTALKVTETSRQEAKTSALSELETLKAAQTNLAGAGEIEREK